MVLLGVWKKHKKGQSVSIHTLLDHIVKKKSARHQFFFYNHDMKKYYFAERMCV